MYICTSYSTSAQAYAMNRSLKRVVTFMDEQGVKILFRLLWCCSRCPCRVASQKAIIQEVLSLAVWKYMKLSHFRLKHQQYPCIVIDAQLHLVRLTSAYSSCFVIWHKRGCGEMKTICSSGYPNQGAPISCCQPPLSVAQHVAAGGLSHDMASRKG